MATAKRTDCADCDYWIKDEGKSEERKKSYGECTKHGGYKFGNEYCFERSNS